MALDQEALQEHIRVTGNLGSADDFMAGLFRGDREREPTIPPDATMRCRVEMTLPTNTRDVSSCIQ